MPIPQARFILKYGQRFESAHLYYQDLSTKNAISVDKLGKTETCPPKHGVLVDKL